MSSAIRYHVVAAPGCHGRPFAPVVSRHRTLRAAVCAARRSDRLRVEPADRSVCLYQATSAQPTRYGYGLYGGADTLTLAEALRIAQRREGAL
ncbi:MAG: hypothetical protein ACRDBH_08220 [Bosea sp. (in: a-proteobacteria)]